MHAPALAIALLTATAAPFEAPPAQEGGEVVVELVVDDAQGRPITDLAPGDLVVAQDGARQDLRSFRFLAEKNAYELRYHPDTGRPGAVTVRVRRPGAVPRGPEGAGLRPRWVPPVAAYEKPLRAALEVASPPADFEYDVDVMRFEEREGTLHHTVLAEIPLRAVTIEPRAAGARAHLAFLLRVKAADGTVVHEGAIDQPVDLEPVAGSDLGVRRFVWSADVHLRPGSYVAEIAAMDRLASRIAVRRLPVAVDAWPAGLRLGSVVFLLASGGAMAGSGHADDPLRMDDATLVPMLRPTLVEGREGRSSVLLTVFPDRRLAAPVTVTLELHRDGQLRATSAVPLPAPDRASRIRTPLALRFSAMRPGSYLVKFVARQGAERAEASTTVEVTAAPRLP